MKVLVLNEKHGVRVFNASTDDDRNRSALRIVRERLAQGYYEGRDGKQAGLVIERESGSLAWELLYQRSRRGAEYEGVEIHHVEEGGL